MLTIGKTKFDPDILEAFAVSEYSIYIPATDTHFWLRPRETDQRVFDKVFLRGEYEPREPIDAAAVKTIVDAGANIGAATLWFRGRFPNARIIAVEPDPANFERLERNCGGLPGVELLLGALWGSDTELALQFDNGEKSLKSWGTRTVEVGAQRASSRNTPAYTIDALVERFGLGRIDYLKLDIEGAEKSVFESPACRWVGDVGVVVAELHDRFQPGCTAAADRALGSSVRQKYRRGENWFFHMQQIGGSAAA